MKRYTATATAALLSLFVLSASAAETAKSDKDLLQGKWHLVSGEFAGRNMPPEMIEGLATTITVEGENWAEANKSKVNDPLRYKLVLDPSKTPKQVELIDLKPDPGEKPKHLLGIYSLEGDTLKLCISRANMDRPTEFKSADRNTMFRTFSRARS
jgi:uncharacterized protein (TIGR03067 family)